MTTGHDSLIAQLTASTFGPATGDPLQDALRKAAMAGAARLGETGQTGFDTDTPFDNVNQAKYIGEGRKPFRLISLGTDTPYFVIAMECVDGALHAVVAVHREGQIPKKESFSKMTLTRNTDGNVHAAPGW